MKVLLTHPGTQYSFHLAKQLYKHKVLFKFHTGIGFGTNCWQAKLLAYLPKKIKSKLANRLIEGLPDDLIHRHTFLELKTIIRSKNSSEKENLLFKRNKKFQEEISDRDLELSDIIIGFDTSSWILAERCKKMKKLFILDVSIGHPISKERIYNSLVKSYPRWQSQLKAKDKKLILIEQQEIAKADLIVVPSDFVKNTYLENSVAEKKIRVNPFGVDLVEFKNKLKRISPGEKIRFLFFGSFTARKGLPFLLDAWSELQLENVELIIAGFGSLPNFVKLDENIKNKGQILKNQRQMLFDNADVFIFPSFFEGFAQVQIEAASCGLPLIATINSGASEIIEDKLNGFLIPTGDKEKLKNVVTEIVTNPELVENMSFNSHKKSLNFSWDNYGLRWLNIIQNFESSNTYMLKHEAKRVEK